MCPSLIKWHELVSENKVTPVQNMYNNDAVFNERLGVMLSKDLIKILTNIFEKAG